MIKKELLKIEDIDGIMKDDFFIVFSMTDGCSVCHADLPRVEKLAEKYNVNLYIVNASRFTLARGKFSLFASPVVMVYLKGKEVHRQASIIDFEELEYRISMIKDSLR